MISPTLGQTLDFVREAHAGQTDRLGAPYWLHCVRVMAGLPADADDEMRHAALLHDVLEDTGLEAWALVDGHGYSDRIVELVRALTRREHETYENYIVALRAQGIGAEIIKIADLRDNLSPERAAGLTPELEARYRKALAVLEGKG